MEVNLLQMTGVTPSFREFPPDSSGQSELDALHTGEDVGKVFSVIWGALDGLPESTGTWRFCALPQGKECDALSKAVGKRYSDFL